MTSHKDCTFCQIVAGTLEAHRVLEDERTMAFLDVRPVFVGHVLLVPKAHIEVLGDLPQEDVAPLFLNAQRLARAVEVGLGAEGSFVAMNNRVSQSVPHLHVHVVPRTKGDGLKGFFWPRQKYPTPTAAAEVAERLRRALQS